MSAEVPLPLQFSSSKRFLSAVSEDSFGYVTGLPVSTLISLGQRVTPPWLYSSSFLDEGLSHWPTLYRGEVDRSLLLPYKGKDWALPVVSVVDIGDAISCNIEVLRDDRRFELSPEILSITEEASRRQLIRLRLLRRRHGNSLNLRVRSCSKRRDKVVLTLSPVSYYDYLRTNLALDYRPGGLRESLRSRVHAAGVIGPLADSELADHIGLSVLVFTADGSLLVSRRSRSVVLRTGRLTSSVAGTLAFDDVRKTTSAPELLRLRELTEELGLTPNDLDARPPTLLGFCRELIRGGSPEFFFMQHTCLSERELLQRRRESIDRWETARKVVFVPFGNLALQPLNTLNDHHTFCNILDTFLDRWGDRATMTLLGGLALWHRHKLQTSCLLDGT